MAEAWWDKPVHVFTSDSTVVAVSRLSRAVDLLMNGWPGDGPAYLEARKAALAAHSKPNDKRAQVKARKAFEEAAREAGILAD